MPPQIKLQGMKIRHYKRLFFLLTVLALLSASCKHENNSIEITHPKAECPMGNIPNDAALVDENAQTYALYDGFANDFAKFAIQYEGVHLHLKAQLPNEWELLYREPLPANQELWLVKSADKDWTYLLITAGERIRDAVPIGLDLASTGKIIESETWTWNRDESGAFIVSKHYEKCPDVSDTTQHQCEIDAVDRYVVGTSGLFECTPVLEADGPQYQLVVLYNLTSTLPDGWYDVMNNLAPFCEENGFYFTTVNAKSDDLHNVPVEDYELNFITTVDISSLVQNNEQGLVLMDNGFEPKTEHFSENVRFLQMKITNYFNSNKKQNL